MKNHDDTTQGEDTSPYDLGAALLEATEEIRRLKAGQAKAISERIYDGAVLVEIREHGETVWTLDDATADIDIEEPDATAIRTGLRQSQEGFAALIGVPIGTVRGWEQGRRKPRGAAAQLLRVAARSPSALRGLTGSRA